MITVSHENIDAYAVYFKKLKDELENIKSDYSSSKVESISETASTATFSSWEDDVSAKLIENKNELVNTTLPAISTGISTGYSKMCTLASNLVTEYNNYEGYNRTYNAKIRIKKEERTDEDTRQLNNASSNRDKSIKTMNGYLKELSQIDFNKEVAAAVEEQVKNGRGLNPNYVPPKPDYEAWNEGMYGKGFWNSDGTHNGTSSVFVTDNGIRANTNANGSITVSNSLPCDL